ncbi:hypothetical protein LJC32_02140 [Oscillospiraceae bacterium OttesenSCG-928-F05]|nr:hypothetical protein [Oscillospiraceae bacterium OttesenSCG-928-F05]
MTTKQRIPATQLSRTKTDEHTVCSQYTAGYCLYTVKSRFAGNEKIDDLLYQIIVHKYVSFGSDAGRNILAKDCPL